jgi:hypothetical protein
MTQLICLVQRCNLADKRLIREHEVFETTEVETEILIRGGIAKKAPAPVKKPDPVDPPMAPEELYQKAQELKEESDDGTMQAEGTGPETPERVTAKKKKGR